MACSRRLRTQQQWRSPSSSTRRRWGAPFDNYRFFYDAGEHADSEVKRIHEAGFTVTGRAQAALDPDVMINKLGCVLKVKIPGDVKARLVTDVHRSGANGRLKIPNAWCSRVCSTWSPHGHRLHRRPPLDLAGREGEAAVRFRVWRRLLCVPAPLLRPCTHTADLTRGSARGRSYRGTSRVSREGLLPHAAKASSLNGQRSTLHESRRFGLSTTATRVAPAWFHHHMPVWAGCHA